MDESYLRVDLRDSHEALQQRRNLFALQFEKQKLARKSGQIFLNHGAFGAPLKCSLELADKWRLFVEKRNEHTIF